MFDLTSLTGHWSAIELPPSFHFTYPLPLVTADKTTQTPKLHLLYIQSESISGTETHLHSSLNAKVLVTQVGSTTKVSNV